MLCAETIWMPYLYLGMSDLYYLHSCLPREAKYFILYNHCSLHVNIIYEINETECQLSVGFVSSNNAVAKIRIIRQTKAHCPLTVTLKKKWLHHCLWNIQVTTRISTAHIVNILFMDGEPLHRSIYPVYIFPSLLGNV